MYIKVRMLAECNYSGRDYQQDKEYHLSSAEYQALSQSCVIIKDVKHDTKFNKIMVVIDHGIGNIILKTPMLIKLREMFPQSIINVLVGRARYREVLEGLKFINNIYSKETVCRDMVYDIIINSLPAGMSLTGLKGRIMTGETMWYVYGHEVDANMKILLILGWDGRNIPDPRMAVEKVDFPIGKYIGISAGYGDEDYWKIKNWGYNKYAELIKLLLVEYPAYKVLILGKGKDRKVLDHVKSDRIIDCVDKYTIRQSAYIVSLCDFMVANDTGLGHIASAVGVRIYSVFGATSRLKNRPYKNGVVIAREDLDCAPCQYTHRWPGCKNRSCMNISVNEVFNAIKSKQKKKFELGVLICTYDRYEFLLTTLNSYVLCKNMKDAKFCIVDDGSCDDYINMAIEQFKAALPVSCECQVISHRDNYGKNRYGETILEGVKALSDCPYVLFSPDDIVVNPWLFDVVNISAKMIGDKIKIISHMADTRARKPKSLYATLGVYDKHYDYVGHTDGFLSLIGIDILNSLSYKHEPAPGGSGVWTALNRQFSARGYSQLRLKESLCFHFGNIKSTMNKNERELHPLRSIRFNLNRKPEVLK